MGSEKRLAQLRRLERRQAGQAEREPILPDVSEPRDFAATEIPELQVPDALSHEQIKILAHLHDCHQAGRPWLCPHECGRTVARFGEQCVFCLAFQGELRPVDWDSLGWDGC